MTKEMLNALEDFEIFIERVEGLLNEIKTDPAVVKGNCDYNHFDLRTYDGEIFSLPSTLRDYLEMWEYVCERYNMFLANDKNPDEMFFDVYFNDVEVNSAFYDNKAMWVFFDKEKGFSYEKDENLEAEK